jgi:hypothetical protein
MARATDEEDIAKQEQMTRTRFMSFLMAAYKLLKSTTLLHEFVNQQTK